MSDSLWPYGLYSPWNSLGQNTGVGSLSLLWGIFPTQGSNPGIPHCRLILYQLSHKGSPIPTPTPFLKLNHCALWHSWSVIHKIPYFVNSFFTFFCFLHQLNYDILLLQFLRKWFSVSKKFYLTVYIPDHFHSPSFKAPDFESHNIKLDYLLILAMINLTSVSPSSSSLQKY